MFYTLNEKDVSTRSTIRTIIKRQFCFDREDAIRRVRISHPLLYNSWKEYGNSLIMNFPNVYYVLTVFG